MISKPEEYLSVKIGALRINIDFSVKISFDFGELRRDFRELRSLRDLQT